MSLLSLFGLFVNLTVLSTFLGIFASLEVFLGGYLGILVNFLYVFLISLFNNLFFCHFTYLTVEFIPSFLWELKTCCKLLG